MSDRRTILVVNAGSSSIKCGLYPAEGGDRSLGLHADIRADGCDLVSTPLAGGPSRERLSLPETGEILWQQAIRTVLDRAAAAAAGPIVAVGHRIVHVGLAFSAPVVVTPEVLAGIEALEQLAPLHQPQGLAGIRAAASRLPAAVHVACFDTAFHHTCPPEAMRFALPRPWHDRGVRRYGFHGLSYESIVGRMPLVTGGLPDRLIVAHLGAGASLAAIDAGRSIATTMGFTPLDGLVMATRSGSIDPGAVLHLITACGLSAAEVERLLTRESGLLGVSGISGDMRVLLSSADPQAADAVGLFCYRAIREIGSLVAALGGLDAIVFTAGIGEHSAEIRRRIVTGLAWLGLDLDPAANAAHGPRISRPDSRVAAWVVPTDEEAVIATHVRREL
jgi:acetate kinase